MPERLSIHELDCLFISARAEDEPGVRAAARELLRQEREAIIRDSLGAPHGDLSLARANYVGALLEQAMIPLPKSDPESSEGKSAVPAPPPENAGGAENSPPPASA